MVCVLAAEGAGVLVCDAMAPSILGTGVKMIPIEPRYEFEFGFLYRRGAERTSEAKRLAEIVREEAASYVKRLPFN
jgi:hypothetical protein